MIDRKTWRDGAALIEACFAKAQNADPQDAPFPLVGAEAQLWQRAQAEAYGHALDMMGVPSALATPPAPTSAVDGAHAVIEELQFALHSNDLGIQGRADQAARLYLTARRAADLCRAALAGNPSALLEAETDERAATIRAETAEKLVVDLTRQLEEAKAAAPHFHNPSTMHMGDCSICGNVADAPQHNAMNLSRKYETTLTCYQGAVMRYETAESAATELSAALAKLTDAFLNRHGCFPLDRGTDDQKLWRDAMAEAYGLIGQPRTIGRSTALARFAVSAG
ncbi:hypothetical protein [Mesorhizobium sp. M0859]|uniref:hypothetical protein n=1 Tax=Mesorhizobium sp. M0859 TaxID=2957014 RepID=UPI00333DC244